MKNQKISAKELEQIRSLEDFDLTMLISDIHDHGWPVASKTLVVIIGHAETLRSKGMKLKHDGTLDPLRRE